MASTVLPNGIIIPEKYSRDWYNDLYHNWQELDNLLGGGTPKDGTLTIQKNGDTVGTFSANQSTNETINIEVPTKTSDLNNDSGFITGVAWDDVTNKPSFATVATSGSYTDLSDKPTIPTATSELTNDSGFITEDSTKIPLAGSNAISGDLIPSTDNSIDIGSSTKNIKALYTKGITINGTQFVPSDYVPRSGGAVLSSDAYVRNVDNSYLRFGGGPTYNTSASLILFGESSGYTSGHARILVNGQNNIIYYFEDSNFAPSGAHVNLGAAGYEWGQIYSTNSTISTSDARFKNSVKDIDDRLLDAWENIEPKQYKFNDATEKKGEKARYHTGYLAQDIQAECEKQGVNASEYGLFCYDEWSEREEEIEEIETEKDGKIVKEKRVIQPKREKGNKYSLRYEEALVVECKYLRRCIERLTARIEELEKENNTK